MKVMPGLIGIVALALSAVAAAQDSYPAGPIRLIVGFAPGGSSDLVARVVAQRLSVQMNTPIVVENKVGAGSNLAADFVAKSRPDGYTLLFNSISSTLSRAFGEKLSYDLLKDLAPISLLATSPQLLFVYPGVPANTISEFIAHVRANPDKLAYGSAGSGSITHLGSLLFLQTNGLSALHVPYKGGAPALTDVVAGRTQFSMQSVTAVLPMVKDKRVKPLVIASLKRSSLLPDVLTFAETVMPGFEMGSWSGMMAPANTSPAIVRRLNSEIAKALQDPEVKSKLAQDGSEVLGGTPEEYAAYVRGELDRWTKVIKAAGIKPE